ncbi:hypothetical protein [Herpetosiphon geysericola]|uniref:Uncharacterized protein n=1 Tax=Herpetosiphon geysericola TaxID=70996 RepID=A0A0P6Z0E4_9CHLR|nr:hypothetical protein [Herpetosiphon geysericola]KPL90307.1 hypothetical protein SE18_06720 [Herpetosiphon geysericola]
MIGYVLVTLAVVSGAFLLGRYQILKRNEHIEAWALQQRYNILEIKRPWLSLGPFLWRTAENDQVYKVELRDQAGENISGWLRYRGFLFGNYEIDLEFE